MDPAASDQLRHARIAVAATGTRKDHNGRARRYLRRHPALRWPAAATLALLAAVIGWLAWPSGPATPGASAPGASRVRQYLNVRACLLTGPDGVARGPASLAWASMESASGATRAMVSYLSAPAGASAAPYLASLAQRQCGVIVAVGHPQAAAVAADAVRFRRVQFVVIAGRAAGGNVTQVQPASAPAIRSAISQAISAAAARGPLS